MHAHSSGISRCCLIDAEKVVQEALSAGMDGIVLTNHYVDYYANDGNYNDLAKRYIKEYYYAKECGEKVGCKVFFGIEVTMELPGNPHVLIYGVSPDFILKHPKIFSYSPEKLYNEVMLCNGFVVQAHPFRGNQNKLLQLKFLDGVEVNCHPLYESTHLQRLTKIAKENGLTLTCGGDYHADTHRPKCGVYFPDSIKDEVELVAHLILQTKIKLCVQEVDQTTAKDVLFELKKQKAVKKLEERLANVLNFFKIGNNFHILEDLLLKTYQRISDKAYNPKIKDDDLNLLTLQERVLFVIYTYDYEIQNGGLSQFFVNSSREYAPFVSEYLEILGAKEHKKLFDEFIKANSINVCDLSAFKMRNEGEYDKLLNLYPFDSFDNEYSKKEKLDKLLSEYSKANNL